jgi:hypothetical protein
LRKKSLTILIIIETGIIVLATAKKPSRRTSMVKTAIEIVQDYLDKENEEGIL